jgi:hypothetical protein
MPEDHPISSRMDRFACLTDATSDDVLPASEHVIEN